MNFFTDLAKILAKDPGSQDATDDANQRALEWARQVGDKEASDRLQRDTTPTARDSRIAAMQTTPMDAVTGLLARKNERRDIRLDAAFQAAKLGKWKNVSNFDVNLICHLAL